MKDGAEYYGQKKTWKNKFSYYINNLTMNHLRNFVTKFIFNECGFLQ